MTEENQSETEGISLKLVVTIALMAMALFAAYLVYSGITGSHNFRKVCEAAKEKRAQAALDELSAIGGVPGPASEDGTIVVQHDGGFRCTVRITNDRVFSALFEEQ